MKSINTQLLATLGKAGAMTMEEAIAAAVKEAMEKDATESTRPAPVVQTSDASVLESKGKSGSLDQAAIEARAKEILVKSNSVVGTAVQQNKEAALLAAKVTTGDVIIGQLTSRVVPKLPMMVRGYADSELGKVVMANLISTALTQYRPGDSRAAYVSEAVMASAAVNLAKSFDINGLIDEVLGAVTLPSEEK